MHHSIREGGNDSMYGTTIWSYSSGVSVTMNRSWREYLLMCVWVAGQMSFRLRSGRGGEEDSRDSKACAEKYWDLSCVRWAGKEANWPVVQKDIELFEPGRDDLVRCVRRQHRSLQMYDCLLSM